MGDDSSYRVAVTALDRLVVAMIPRQFRRPFGPLVRLLLRLVGVDFLGTAGPGLLMPHSTSGGLVVNVGVRLGAEVTLMHGVTLGRADGHRRPGRMDLTVGDGVFVGAGAMVLGRAGRPLVIGDHAVIGAGAVVLDDVGPGEVWAGNPARLVGKADPLQVNH